jgi:hypothetical protein
MFPPICGNGGADQYELRQEPNGIYLVYRRLVPCADYAALGVNDGELIPEIHFRENDTIGFLGSVDGIDVKQR